MYPPKVSVVIPTYNYARYLDEAIESVLSQTFTDFELIIVDNASTDNTDAVVEKYLSDSRVSYYKNETDIGLGKNFDKALSYARGEYIKFLNADDKFHPELLEKFVRVMEENPGVSLVTCNQEIFGSKTGDFILPFSNLQPGKKILFESLKTHNWIGGPTSVMIRQSNLKLGGYRTDLNFVVDWEMWARQLLAGDCYIVPDKLVFSREHSNQATVTLTKNYSRRFEEYQFYKEMYQRFKDDQEIRDDLKRIRRRKAKDCVRVVYKVLPALYRKRYLPLVRKAISIGIAEGVLF